MASYTKMTVEKENRTELHEKLALTCLLYTSHEHIQKQHVKAYPGLDICQKLHGLCIGGQLQLHPPQGAVLLQKILHRCV